MGKSTMPSTLHKMLVSLLSGKFGGEEVGLTGRLPLKIVTISPFFCNVDSTIFSWALNQDDVSQPAWQVHVAM